MGDVFDQVAAGQPRLKDQMPPSMAGGQGDVFDQVAAHTTGGAGGSWGQLAMQPSDARTIPNPRIRNLQNPVDPSWGPGRSLYEGAKTGAQVAGIPSVMYGTLPQLIKGAVGGAAGGYAGSKGAEVLGAGEFGQEVAGDVGGLVGGGVLSNVESPNLLAKGKALSKVGSQEAFSHIPGAGRLVRRPSIMDYINALRAKAPTPEEAPTGPDVYSPGFRQPRAYYGGQPPEPIPPRQGDREEAGLLLRGEVQKPLEGEYVPSLRAEMQAEPPYAEATEVQPQAEGPLPAPYRQVGAGIVQDDLSGPAEVTYAARDRSGPRPNWTAGKIPPRSGLALPGATNPTPQKLVEQVRTAKDVTPALQNRTGVPDYYATDEKAWQRYPQANSPQDVEETRTLQEQIRGQAAAEQSGRLLRGNEEGFARNTRQGPTKSELTGTAQKPVRLTKTPSAKASGTAPPAEDLNNPEVLQGLVEKSLRAANKAKKGSD